MSNKNLNEVAGFTFILLFLFVVNGCGSGKNNGLATLKKLNESNVAKVRTCFLMYQSRFQKLPKNKEELMGLLNSGSVDKNLKRIGINPQEIEDIFISERDGEPIKIQWKAKMVKDVLGPVAFEAVGVDGVRLVAAGSLLEVDNDEEYDRLWNGGVDLQRSEELDEDE